MDLAKLEEILDRRLEERYPTTRIHRLISLPKSEI